MKDYTPKEAYEELGKVFCIDFLGNNHFIGHLLDININDK